VANTRSFSGPTARTLRTNCRALGRALAAYPEPAPVRLPRERAKLAYTEREISAYLALCDAQPTRCRRLRCAALICLGAGAGLIGADLHEVRGNDVVCRSGGVLVEVGGRRPRAVPVLSRYQARLWASAAFAGTGYLIGGTEASRRNVASALVASLSGGTDLPRLEQARLRATWLAELAGLIGLPAFMAATGVDCSQRLGDIVARLPACPPARLGRARGGGLARGPELLSPEGLLGRAEAVVDAAGVAEGLEAALPIGVRPRQLSARTLLVGMLVVLAEGRPAQLSRVLRALGPLNEVDRSRLGVVSERRTGPHALTYRQVEHTARLVTRSLAKAVPDGEPSAALASVCAALLEASEPAWAKSASTSLAVDWTDLESFACPPVPDVRTSAEAEASWGHRRGDGPGQKDEVFYGYYLSAATMVNDETGPAVPELVRRATLSSCRADAVPAFVPALAAMAASGVAIGDVLAGSGYAHRRAEHWAAPLRALGAKLVTDPHPADRGPRGTFGGATCANGNLYCPATPAGLLNLVPLARDATAPQIAAHDQTTADLAHYKLARTCGYDQDGYHRVTCPAVMGKLRCPRRPASMALWHERPTVMSVPEGPPRCCGQQTLTVPPAVNAKTAQSHDYPSAAWRASYARRTAAERTFSTIKDPGQQRHLPGLVPAHGAQRHYCVRDLLPGGAQLAGPGRLRGPGG
jgi:hypothetical protein